MNYEDALTYLDSLNKFGIRLGLDRIKRLLELMGNPEQKYRTIHVTGTNGKGSTTAMINAILGCSGIKAGMYTSPHLVDYTERIRVNGCEITQVEFSQAVSSTKQYVDIMLAEGAESPTQFEVLTAAAFYYFASIGVEYAVIEVGLGGLLDSTNVIIPEVAVITNVAMDHADRCGGTLSSVAQHKAGIIKPGIPVITAVANEIQPIIEEKAQAMKSPLYIYGKHFFSEDQGVSDYKQIVVFESENYGKMERLKVNLLGLHQVENSALAIMTAMILQAKDLRITSDSIANGLADVAWPGRFEIIEGTPKVIIDGAHNPAGAKMLRLNLDNMFTDRSIVFLLGILQDKDITGIVESLIKPQDIVVVTSPDSERAAPPEMVSNTISARWVEVSASIEEGLNRAYQLAGDGGIVCVAGSLYLIGFARRIIYNRQKKV
ncbi:bifunctional folylpolyglutamate synthase/dihydrofolate synthase [Dendrosporobacter sp. 1207_IL3150]|uniref:bifunctional folylpolyglutamate synthase/dihydrofolate synthase n=1 Tax=Dendrosporobacter sp. 1207_IL3150 TaxID=3084054 RepID=UPI002FDA5052